MISEDFNQKSQNLYSIPETVIWANLNFWKNPLKKRFITALE